MSQHVRHDGVVVAKLLAHRDVNYLALLGDGRRRDHYDCQQHPHVHPLQLPVSDWGTAGEPQLKGRGRGRACAQVDPFDAAAETTSESVVGGYLFLHLLRLGASIIPGKERDCILCYYRGIVSSATLTWSEKIKFQRKYISAESLTIHNVLIINNCFIRVFWKMSLNQKDL